jgi:VWFA-related protein
MIILTDGDDRGSQKKSGDAISAAVKNNVFVFVVWVGDRDECSDAPDIPHPLRPPAVQLPDVLHDPAWYCNKTMYWWSKCPGYFIARCISEETGGRFIDVGGNRKQLDAAFQKIQEELRTQYWASYTPSNAKTDGTFRRINVDCHGDQGQDLKVRVRKGYYAAQAGIQPKR